MAEYKRKRRSAFTSAPKVNKKRIKDKAVPRDIKMVPQGEEKPEKNNMRVVRGKKLANKRRFKITAITVAVIAAAVALCQLIMPAGIIETASTALHTIGGGSYPISLESTDSINTVSKGTYYYLLTNSNIEAYSNAGKRIFSYAHGFENPVLKTSKTRALVFEQDGKQALIFTHSGLKKTVDSKQSIKNAAIGDNGTYALVTSPSNYAAAVSVYKKSGELVYEWFSSKDLVNNVAVSPTGKKIAVATVSSTVGAYNSKVLVLGFKSATPLFEKGYENTVIYNIDTTFAGGFSVLTANNYNFIKWSNFKFFEYKNEYNTAMFRAGNNGVAVVYNRESDKTDNRIAIFSSNGKLKREIEFKGIITDFALKNQHIYCVSDTKVYILDNDGSIMRSADCGFGVGRSCPLGQSTVAVITDNAISKIKLEQE